MGLPSDEQMRMAMDAHVKGCLERIEREGPQRHPRAEAKTALDYWFPLVEKIVQVPKTIIIKSPLDEHDRMMKWLLNGESGVSEDFTRLTTKILDAAKEITGNDVSPFFLRTAFTSGKHDWRKTCYVNDRLLINSHIYQLVEYSEIADMLGLPTDVWVVREMLDTEPLFYAFGGKMPIVKEFRFFVNEGKIEHVQPYWPPNSIRLADAEGWEETLQAASILPPLDLMFLTIETQRINEAVPGYWSVDWLMTKKRGWFMTDMAEGNVSFKWEPDAK